MKWKKFKSNVKLQQCPKLDQTDCLVGANYKIVPKPSKSQKPKNLCRISSKEIKEYTFILPMCAEGAVLPRIEDKRKKIKDNINCTIALLDKLNNLGSPIIGTTDHYSHWYDSKSCSSRINSSTSNNVTKDTYMNSVDLPLYTTVTPKSFLPPSPLRTKQFVMPLKLQQPSLFQLEPQRKPAPTDLTVTFVHRKLQDSKQLCPKSAVSRVSSKQKAAPPPPVTVPLPTYPDPMDRAPSAYCQRLAEMTSHQLDTIRFERNRKTKTRTRSNANS